MKFLSYLVKPIAIFITKRNEKWINQPVRFQQKILLNLVEKAKNTTFGQDHHFDKITNYDSFKKNIPISDYENLKPYIERVKSGESDVLWPGKPLYFAKTSGTTSGTKYIPISKESISYHINSARDALFSYVNEKKDARFFDHKLIFLSGSPEIETINGIYVGRLSGISNHHVPQWLRKNQMPTYKTNCIEDWEQKVDAIVEETLPEKMSLISGIPPWVQMYFDKLETKTGKKIKDIFPNFSLFVYGGVNFEPYKQKLFESIGKKVDSIETYPASEGFIAYQNSQNERGLLLLVNNGIFYEFITVDSYFSDAQVRICIENVEIGVNYALIINSNAGLWGYSIGDTIKFVSLFPHKIVVTGRIKHFISAFGEHVIAQEVEKSMEYACMQHPEVRISEFTVAPQVVDKQGGLPYHEWFIAFSTLPNNMASFAKHLNTKLCELNTYYDDLIKGNVLQQLKITVVEPDAFINYMKTIGKLGGQNKVPRLSNDREIVEKLKNK